MDVDVGIYTAQDTRSHALRIAVAIAESVVDHDRTASSSGPEPLLISWATTPDASSMAIELPCAS
jgi:hypothetical protein